MDRFRTIQPGIAPQYHLTQGFSDQQTTRAEGAGLLEPSRSKGQTRQHHTEDEWDAIRPVLTELLLSHELKDAVEIIKRTHNFEAGLRSYRSKVAGWGLKQHQSSELLGVVVAKREKRKRDEGKNTVVIARGMQLPTERLDLFQRRAKDKQSPSAATPQSIEYYTPANNGLTPEVVRTPAGLQDSLRYLGLLDALPVNKEHKDFCKRLMTFDQTSEPMVVLRPEEPTTVVTKEPTTQKTEERTEERTGEKMERLTTSRSPHFTAARVQRSPGTQREALRTESQVPEPPTHDLHQGGHVAIVGRGRFAKKEKALTLLWQTKRLGRDMQQALDSPKASGKVALPGPPAIAGEGISYIVHTRSRSAETEQKQQRLINFIQSDNHIQSVLGLTKQDRIRWLQTWSRTAEDDAPLIFQTADHLFGDLIGSYPEMDVLEVLVYFYTTSPRREPILIRAAAGWDPRDEHRDCLYCDDTFQIVDFMGSSGAVKLHISDSNSGIECFPTFDSFHDAFISSQKTIYTSWSEVAYLFQGWYYVPLLRKCPCESRTHKNQRSEHYINVFDEQMIDFEEFDPEATSYLRVPFEAFPSDERRAMVYGREGRISPLEETWGPLGEEYSEEEFEPYPEAEHNSVSDSKAVNIVFKRPG